MNKRFALFQVLFSVVALGAVIWWASHQDAPEIPSGTNAIAWLVLALALYAFATVVRAERWHAILKESQIDAKRADCYGLSVVGYMGNNVLPARAGEALRVVLLDGKTNAGKRKILGLNAAKLYGVDVPAAAASTNGGEPASRESGVGVGGAA